jgi:chorismate mutase
MESKSDLETLRTDIDHIDQDLVSLLAARFRITKQIGQYKRAQNSSPVDKQREQEQFSKIEELAFERRPESGVCGELSAMHH